LAATFLLISCNNSVKGGTIEVTNGYTIITYVDIVKGADIGSLIKQEGDGTPIMPGKTETFTFDEDGFYTVVAIPPVGFLKTVYLTSGGTERVVVK